MNCFQQQPLYFQLASTQLTASLVLQMMFLSPCHGADPTKRSSSLEKRDGASGCVPVEKRLRKFRERNEKRRQNSLIRYDEYAIRAVVFQCTTREKKEECITYKKQKDEIKERQRSFSFQLFVHIIRVIARSISGHHPQ